MFRFVSNLLTTVLSWLFEEVLAPILIPILQEALKYFMELWLLIYSRFIYLLFSGILKLIDYLEMAFDVFIGLKDVTYTEANGHVITGTLVEVLMQQKAISTAFWVLTMGALSLALLLTVYATARSAFDLDFENKRPVSKVLGAMMKTFVQFFTVPFFVYFFLKLSAVILKGVTSVLNFGGETTLGRIVFTIASLDAAKQEGYNISDAAAGVDVGITDSVRAPFYNITGSNLKDYGKISDVDAVFRLEDFDYLIGFIAAVFLLFTIGICLIIFVQRVFELCLLYLASPYFVCMIPLDDGERFSRWREMFIGKCFTGFGSVVGMRMFLMICPMIMGNRIRFGTSSSPEMDYMMKLFFIAGGAWAVYKSGPMITSLISSQAGSSEANTAATVGGMLYAYTAGSMIAKGGQFVSAALRGSPGKKQKAGQEKEGTGQKDDQQGKFNGNKKGRQTASRGIPGKTGAAAGRPAYPGHAPSGFGRPGRSAYGRPGYGRPGYSQPRRAGLGPPGYGQPKRAGLGSPGYGQPGRPGYGRPGFGQPKTAAFDKSGFNRPGQAAAKPGQEASDIWESKVSLGGTSAEISEEKKAAAAAAKAGRARSASAPLPPGKGIVPPGAGGAGFGIQRPGVPRAGTGRPKPGAGRPGAQRPGAYSAYRSPYAYGYYRSPYGRRPIPRVRPQAPASAYGANTQPSPPGSSASALGAYAPPSVDVFAAAAARGNGAKPYAMGRAYPYGSPYGSYRMNWHGYGYTFNTAGAAVSRSFPGSAVRSGAEITRAGYRGSAEAGSAGYRGSTETGSAGYRGSTEAGSAGYRGSTQQAGTGYSRAADMDSGSAASSGGVAGSSASSANARIGGNERRYQAVPMAVPAAVHTSSSPVQLKYSDIGIRGVSHNGGAGTGAFTRRNSR